LIYACIILGITTILTSYFAIRFGLIILSFQDSLEESLDVIDEKYANISSICERPLFYDSPEVRQVLEDIKSTRDSLHKIAYSLSSEFVSEEKDEEEEQSGD